MLFKEKLYLANCDSVRGLGAAEVRKRFLTAVVFADGVVLSPNVLIDNPGILDALAQHNVTRWFRGESLGKIVVRGYRIRPGSSLCDYLDALPGDYRVSLPPGRTHQTRHHGHDTECAGRAAPGAGSRPAHAA